MINEDLGSICLLEPFKTTHDAILTTKAYEESDCWRLEGEMTLWDDARSTIFIVFASTNDAAAHRGISAFIVEKPLEGLTAYDQTPRRKDPCLGEHRMMFKNLRLPKENIVGNIGDGFKILSGMLDEDRLSAAAHLLGITHNAYLAAKTYARARLDHGNVRDMNESDDVDRELEQINQEITDARVSVYDAAQLADSGKTFARESAMALAGISHVAEQLGSARSRAPLSMKIGHLDPLLRRLSFNDRLAQLRLLSLTYSIGGNW